MFDLGIEAAERFDEIAFYGHLWLIEFRDCSRAIVIEDVPDDPEPNFISTPCEKA